MRNTGKEYLEILCAVFATAWKSKNIFKIKMNYNKIFPMQNKKTSDKLRRTTVSREETMWVTRT